ncbi:MAG: hypothetical protein CMJ62_21310 [Planctomycetaceae bacterium]|nr:hypothetical protein [Planctomycetaceae bacterium]|tara:strand:+ start:3142 stop:3591 length:450 start_codon:yes stop_codon:yes gene_type:complete
MSLTRWIVLVAILSAPFAAMSEGLQRNGNFWRALAEDRKLYFLAGILDGSQLGRDLTSMGCYGSKLHENPDGLACSLEVQSNFIVAADKYMQNVSTEQIRDGLDEFYADYRNRGIHARDAVFIVLRQIAGDPNIDTLIINNRIRASSPN